MDDLSRMIDDFIKQVCPTELLWERLATEGNFKLIRKLRRVEMGEPGFGTIVVPKEGFSESDDTHNLVLEWLEERDINVVNLGLETARNNLVITGQP